MGFTGWHSLKFTKHIMVNTLYKSSFVISTRTDQLVSLKGGSKNN